MRIAFLGLGLIGGSIARAIAERSASGEPRPEIVAWTRDGRGPAAAREAGIVDDAPSSVVATVVGADLIVLAAPPLACLDLLTTLAHGRGSFLASTAVVTDVASTKVAIVERAAVLGLPFVGGHPMAGSESSGFAAADGGLFVDRPWVVVEGPTSPPDGAERVGRLARSCGARPVAMTAAEHDDAVAAISHLPLVVAAALVEVVVGPDPAAPGSASVRPGWPAARALAAGGWESATRLARGDAAMAAGIATTNAGPLAARVHDLEQALADWRAALEGGDSATIAARFADARARLAAAGDDVS